MIKIAMPSYRWYNLFGDGIQIESVEYFESGIKIYTIDDIYQSRIDKLVYHNDIEILNEHSEADIRRSEKRSKKPRELFFYATCCHDLRYITDCVVMTIGETKSHIKITIKGVEFDLTDTQMLTPTEFRRQLLQYGKVMNVPQEDWDDILQYWMGNAKRIYTNKDGATEREI